MVREDELQADNGTGKILGAPPLEVSAANPVYELRSRLRPLIDWAQSDDDAPEPS